MKTTRKKIRFELNDPSKLYEGGLNMLLSCLDSFASTIQWIIWEIDIVADLTSLGTNVSELKFESGRFPPSRLFSWSEINEIVSNIIDVEEFIVVGFHRQMIHTNVNDFLT